MSDEVKTDFRLQSEREPGDKKWPFVVGGYSDLILIRAPAASLNLR